MTEFRVLLEPEEDGANMVGEVSIPNPSVLTIELVRRICSPLPNVSRTSC